MNSLVSSLVFKWQLTKKYVIIRLVTHLTPSTLLSPGCKKDAYDAYEPSQGQTHLRASVRAIRHKGGDSILMVVVRRRTSCYVLWLSSKVIIFPIIFKSNRVRGSFRYGYFHEKVVSLSLKIYAWHSPIPCFSLHGKHFWENVFEVVQISFDKFLVSLFDFISNTGLPFRNLMVDYNVWQHFKCSTIHHSI